MARKILHRQVPTARVYTHLFDSNTYNHITHFFFKTHTHADTHTRTFRHIHTFLTRTHTQMHTHLFFNTQLYFSETNALIKKHTLNANLSFKTYTYTGTSTGSPLRGGQRIITAGEDARRRAVAEFERWQRRAVSNIDPSSCLPRLRKRTHSFV